MRMRRSMLTQFYWNLKFRDFKHELKYEEINNLITSKFYKIAMSTLALALIALLIANFVKGYFIKGGIYTGIFLVLLLPICFYHRFKRILPRLLSILCLGFIICSLVSIRLSFEDLSPKFIFYVGFAFGLFQNFVQNTFPQLQFKLLSTVTFIICRYSIIWPDHIISVVLCTLFDVAIIIMLYYSENNMRKSFQVFFEQEYELSKFKNFIAYHMHENIVILNNNLDKKLFVTNSFATSFRAESLGQIKTLFSNMIIDHETLNEGILSNFGPPAHFHHNTSLFDFLNRFKNTKTDSDNAVHFNVDSTDLDTNKTTPYEIKMFHLNWDKTDAVAILLTDLTEQKMILALQTADENKDKVIQTVSHELRTPINGILGVLQIIEQEFSEPKLLSYCKDAKICSKLLLNLVNSILDLTQIRNNCIKITPALFRVHDLLDEISSIFKSQCENKGLKFEVQLGDHIPDIISSDYNRLMQIIVNLLANALKYTYEGKISLKIERTLKYDELRFVITDTGVGIKEETKAGLFKMFGRIDDSSSKSKNSTEGVGLGLTSSNGLVRLLNPDKPDAQIQLISEVGQGTTFSFTISTDLADDAVIEIGGDLFNCTGQVPLEKGDKTDEFHDSMAEYQGERDHSPEKLVTSLNSHFAVTMSSKNLISKLLGKSTRRVRLTSTPQSLQHLSSFGNLVDNLNSQVLKKSNVLIVDDNPFNIMIASKMVEKLGFTVVTAFNGQEAIAKAKGQGQENFFKIILMDCQMPIMDGYEATKALCAMMKKGEIPETPICAITANDTKKDQERCFESGMLEHIAKPLKESDLLRIFDKYIKS